MNFSKNQQAVISHIPDHNLLVAASAGSGKTTVLIEHVYQQLVSGKNIDRFLISTFTDAAALEMKNRLEKRIRTGIAEEDGRLKKHLQEQLLLLNSAAIGTLDSFSLRIIERYYSVIGLDPRYRMLADQTEKNLLVKDVLDDTFDEVYHDENFLRLLNNFSSASHDQDLKNLVIKLNTMAETRADPDLWLDSIAENYRLNAGLTEGSFWQQLLKPQIVNRASAALYELLSAKKGVENLEDYHSYIAYLADTISLIRGFIEACSQKDWQQMRDYFVNNSWPRSARKSGKNEEEANYFSNWIKPWIDEAKDSYRSIESDFLFLNESQWLDVSKQSLGIVEELIQLTKVFRKKFAFKKRELSLLDFSDGEQFAYQILQKQSVRKEIQSLFDEVLVDEYQDINDLQENILTDVSNGSNFFMVGDLKQSIYGFRQADPDNFSNKYIEYKKRNGGELIELSENYRSQHNVADFTNTVFRKLMDRRLGGIDYRGDVELKAANRDYPKNLKSVADISIFDIDKENSDDEDFNTREAEIKIIAAKIQKLVGQAEIYDRQSGKMRPVVYRDITILERSHSWENDIQTIFQKYHIPINVAAGNFLQEFEVSIVLSFLKIIDNPHQDIPLVAVLRSPIYGLDENQLAEIRIVDMKHDYFSAVQAYAETGQDSDLQKELADFLTQLSNYRKLAADNQIVDLIWQIYNDTNWPEYVAGMVGGSQRQANLHALYQYAQQLSDNHFVGLFSFIRYVEQLMDSVEDFAQAPVDMGQEAVSVMTIHAAKGLEFPIVFLLNLDKQIDNRDSNGSMVVDFDNGIGIDFIHPVSQVKIPTIQKIAVAEKIKEKNWAEEMKLLYVALTRSEQRLYLVGSSKKMSALIHNWGTPVSTGKNVIAFQDRMRAKSYQSWIGMSLANSGYIQLEKVEGEYSKKDLTFKIKAYNAQTIPEIIGNKTVVGQGEQKETRIDLFQSKKILDYKYPYKLESELPAYHNVSELKRIFEDPDALLMPEMDSNRQPEITDLPQPAFINKGNQEQASSTDKGTATHLILEKIDWKKKIDKKYLQQLLKENVSDQKIRQSIELDQIIWFVNSEFGEEIKRRESTLKREQTFAMLISAKQIYRQAKTTDPVLVHGIIDGYFINRDLITLFDYKTDRLSKDYVSKLKERYSGQLNLYAAALSSIYPNLKVARKVIVGLQGKSLIYL
ncbi:helicase-exonuclease AddAB subunit AddA [Oenococcus sp. UCMA 14587]|nr:helicase-exonuclease AddAB subunit AddA [Oenococcus sp. UCMA 14587]